MMFKQVMLAATLATTLATTVAYVGASVADELHEEIVKLKFAVDSGDAQVLVLDDFENFPVGATETVYTESGTEALVTRLEDSLLVELDGEQHEVRMTHIDALADVDMQVVELLGDEAAHHERSIIIHKEHEVHVVDGDGAWVTEDGEFVEFDLDVEVDVDMDGDFGTEKHVVIRVNGDELEGDFDLHSAHGEGKKVIMIKQLHGEEDAEL